MSWYYVPWCRWIQVKLWSLIEQHERGIVVHVNHVAETNQWKVIKPWVRSFKNAVYVWLVSLTPSGTRKGPTSWSPIIPAQNMTPLPPCWRWNRSGVGAPRGFQNLAHEELLWLRRWKGQFGSPFLCNFYPVNTLLLESFV